MLVVAKNNQVKFTETSEFFSDAFRQRKVRFYKCKQQAFQTMDVLKSQSAFNMSKSKTRDTVAPEMTKILPENMDKELKDRQINHTNNRPFYSDHKVYKQSAEIQLI